MDNENIQKSENQNLSKPNGKLLRAPKPRRRVSYSFTEVAEMVGKERTWVYRQVEKGRIKAITGFGAAMVAASEIERIFGSEVLQ